MYTITPPKTALFSESCREEKARAEGTVVTEVLEDRRVGTMPSLRQSHAATSFWLCDGAHDRDRAILRVRSSGYEFIYRSPLSSYSLSVPPRPLRAARYSLGFTVHRP